MMSNKSLQLNPTLQQWVHDHALRESLAMQHLRNATASLEDSVMQTSPEQLQFLSFLAKSIGTSNAIEVGVYTGASALAIAEVLPTNGKLIACDLTDEYLEIATQAWSEASVVDRIDMRIGPASETLSSLLEDPLAGSFDFMYIDADKVNNKLYYELGVKLLRAGGIIAVDNIFYDGMVADPTCQDDSTIAIRELVTHLQADTRIDFSVIPIGDGLAISRIH